MLLKIFLRRYILTFQSVFRRISGPFGINKACIFYFQEITWTFRACILGTKKMLERWRVFLHLKFIISSVQEIGSCGRRRELVKMPDFPQDSGHLTGHFRTLNGSVNMTRWSNHFFELLTSHTNRLQQLTIK